MSLLHPHYLKSNLIVASFPKLITNGVFLYKIRVDLKRF